MPKYILKLGTKYMEYSTISDAPLTDALTFKELKSYIRRRYGTEGLERLQERLSDADRCGSSSGESLEDAIACNRAGPGESCLTLDQFFDCYAPGEIVHHLSKSQG